ncbi:MAG: hypothetical protein J6M02_04880 [Clostridia bacterium]|nr:hypothetical protein [Clostridia bacterium]
MKKKLKGGIETIIALIIIVGLVLALIISVVVPMAGSTKDLGDEGTAGLKQLQQSMGYTSQNG